MKRFVPNPLDSQDGAPIVPSIKTYCCGMKSEQPSTCVQVSHHGFFIFLVYFICPLFSKWFVFLISALGTGLTGGLIYMQKARISPDAAFSVLDWTAYVIFIVVIGGIGTIEGPIIGVIVFFLLQNMLADYGSWYLLILGVIGIAIMLFAPKGLWGFFSKRTGIQIFPVQRRLVHKNQNSEDKNNG